MRSRVLSIKDSIKDFFHPTWKKLFIMFLFSTLFILTLFGINSSSNSFLSVIYTSLFIILNPFWLFLIENSSSGYPILAAVYNFIMLIIFPVYWYVIASSIDKALIKEKEKTEKGKEEYVELGKSYSYRE